MQNIHKLIELRLYLKRMILCEIVMHLKFPFNKFFIADSMLILCFESISISSQFEFSFWWKSSNCLLGFVRKYSKINRFNFFSIFFEYSNIPFPKPFTNGFQSHHRSSFCYKFFPKFDLNWQNLFEIKSFSNWKNQKLAVPNLIFTVLESARIIAVIIEERRKFVSSCLYIATKSSFLLLSSHMTRSLKKSTNLNRFFHRTFLVKCRITLS